MASRIYSFMGIFKILQLLKWEIAKKSMAKPKARVNQWRVFMSRISISVRIIWLQLLSVGGTD
jgi:hypothetical protein